MVFKQKPSFKHSLTKVSFKKVAAQKSIVDITARLANNRKTMKFGQLIECNMRNIFLAKSYTKCDEETSPRPFSEKLKLAYLRINSLRSYTVCCHCMPS